MKNVERARLVWQALVACAAERKTLTYGLLADMLETHPRALIGPLEFVMQYCSGRGLPPLTVLVVNQETGIPGSGLTTVEDLAKDREKVFGVNWRVLLPPTEDDFKEEAE